MGLYSDLQNDIGNALLTDLLDAYVDFELTVFASDVYDPISGTPSSVKTVYPFKGVALTVKSQAGMDDPEEEHDLVLLVMDSDRPAIFEEEQMITFSGSDYRLMKINVDPVKASWTLSCFKWN